VQHVHLPDLQFPRRDPLQGLLGKAGTPAPIVSTIDMTEAIVTSALAPLMKDPSPRAELVSQLVTGETGTVVEEIPPWFRLRRELDGYEGWVHRGYLRPVDTEVAMSWRERATFLAEDAELEDLEGRRIRLPLLARLAGCGDEWELASGVRGRVVAGLILPADTLARSARSIRPIDWIQNRFAGAPYLWGGISPWGVDCSGLVQTAFAARGECLPRDSHDQASLGVTVGLEEIAVGDLLFFREKGERITHVAFAGDNDTLVHSTLACGGVVTESWKPGTRAAFLREQLVAVRRINCGTPGTDP
jgi:cell wall-associated NlpC family hydrolase